MQASKWLQVQVLLNAEEMEALFRSIGEFFIFATGSLVESGRERIERGFFLDRYRQYVGELQSGCSPNDAAYRSLFSSVFSMAEDHLFAMPAGDCRVLLRVKKPVVQLQYHKISYSHLDGKFRPHALAKDGIAWGIQFSYPTLYLDPISKAVEKIGDSFPNTKIFKDLQKWLRSHSTPTSFFVGGKESTVPMRLGKQCMNWINAHPDLVKQQIMVRKNFMDEG